MRIGCELAHELEAEAAVGACDAVDWHGYSCLRDMLRVFCVCFFYEARSADFESQMMLEAYCAVQDAQCGKCDL